MGVLTGNYGAYMSVAEMYKEAKRLEANTNKFLAQLKEQPKMTREEALAKLPLERWYGEDGKRGYLLDSLEKLGLLKFDEPKEVVNIFKVNNDGSSSRIWGDNKWGKQIGETYGTIKLELWPEGLVLWVGGEIRWKSWEKSYKVGDAVTVEYYVRLNPEPKHQAGIIK